MSGPPAAPVIPVILSGGSGTRLWPLSRRGRPKQLLDLTGAGTMLALTGARVADPKLFAAPIVVAGAGQADAVAAEIPAARLIVEPAARNTAPAIALAALAVADADVLLVLPSDHRIGDGSAFREAVRRGLPFAREGWIVTFGMKAERAETGYGYIERGPALGEGVFAGARFVEKPDAATAQAYVAGGRHDWNAGIFLMRADAYLDALARHAPEIAAAVRAGGSFADAPALSIDHAVMEKAEKVAVVPVEIGWSDVGSFAALHEVSETDAGGNVVAGPALALDARGCLIRSEGPLIAAIGVEDLIIVATRDAVLVVPKAQSQRVREAVDRLEAEGRDDLL
jgi:mannose-1-phosphate guanylyltransferase/mannose-1-phosphate guanylyltransferase/mannose-6-phosphate isomerase